MLNIDSEKEMESHPIEILVSVNGTQVWLDDKLDEPEFQETPVRKSFADITTTNKIQK